MDLSFKNLDDSNLKIYLKNLEKRIKRIEDHIDLDSSEKIEENHDGLHVPDLSGQDTVSLEFQIGQYWFAKFGILILAIGIAFLLTFPYPNLPAALPSLFGYFLVGGVLSLSYFWRESFSHISRYLLGGSMVLFYFTTLRLYWFSSHPALTNKTLEISFLLTVVIINLIIAYKKESEYLAGLSLTLGYLTSLLSGSTYFIFISISIFSILIVYLKLYNQWEKLFIYGIFLTQLTHILWFINNPILGNRIELVSSPSLNIFFIVIYIIILTLGNLFRRNTDKEEGSLIPSTFLISFGFYVLFILLTLTKFNTHLGLSHLIISLFFLLFSAAFWIREKSKYSTFFYAIIGYSALSVAIIAQFERPDYFIWLSWQSILVITTAIWFRSKFIVVANFLIFLIIFISYLFITTEISMVSLGFGVVALMSARIMNWKKHRLELKTELMRNSYLATAFFIFPYTLYHLVPGGYVILAWVAISLLYYIASLLLKNNKYRWMAVLTILLTVVYIFIIGIINLEGVLRITSFLVLGIILISLSLIYTRIKSKSTSADNSE
jgi:hypothetical protein